MRAKPTPRREPENPNVFATLRDPNAWKCDLGLILSRADVTLINRVLGDTLAQAEAEVERWRSIFAEHESIIEEDRLDDPEC